MKTRLAIGESVCRALLVLALVGLTSCRPGADRLELDAATRLDRPPRMKPDYAGVTLPPNIAPLNFVLNESSEGLSRFRVRLSGVGGAPVESDAEGGSVVVFPEKAWHALLAANRGGSVTLEVFGRRDRSGPWSRFTPVTNRVAPDAIDSTLVYRYLKPLYNYYSELGIYQRDLGGFSVRPVLENRDFGGGCLNCHTFLNRHPDQFALHIRGVSGPQPMLLVRSNEVTRINKTAGYISWHPSGELIAFSANKLSLFFHTLGETRDVFDAESNLGVYWIASNTVSVPPPIALPDRLETWPSWAPDGRSLYYCSAPKLRRERHRQVRYDLMRISFDLATGAWGQPETLVSAADTGLSAAQPRVSPDGRWLLFCLAKYGHFPVYQPSSDLYLMDLETRRMRKLEINSDESDSWHCWSSNGRWVVFSSKRGNGLFARPYFTHVDDHGQFAKPFVLPQEDPTFYESCIHTFNVPELVQGPITIPGGELARAVLWPAQSLTPADPSPQQHREEQNAPLPPTDPVR